MIALPAAEMNDAIGGNARRLTKFIGRDLLEEFGINPKDRIGRAEGALDLLQTHFVFYEIVGKRSAAGPFVAGYMELVESECAFVEMQLGAGRIHPGAAKAGALGRDRAVTRPGGWEPARSAKSETDSRRPPPFPFAEKPAQLGRREGTEHSRIDCAFDVEPEIIRRVQQIARQLARFVAHAHPAQHPTFAVPRKISA